MRRRALLGIAAAATVGHAGCLDSGSDDETPTGTDGHGHEDGHGHGDGHGDNSPTEPDDPNEGSNQDHAGTETDHGDAAGTETETSESTPGETRLADRDMEIKSVECGGSGGDHWEVDVDDGVVTVDGEIGGNSPCYSARIASAAYDGDADVLRTTIESYDDSRDGEGCARCIADIYYRATFTFEDGEPGDVEVQHDGREG